MARRCLIVDDSEAFLASATRLLESEGLEVVGTATGGAEALRLAAELRPDLALVDVALGEENGLDLARQLTSARRPVPVILISTHSEEDLADLLAGSPALGFIPKPKLGAETVRKLLG